MSRYLNLDDAEALRVRCDARAGDLFNDKREPQLQVVRLFSKAGTQDEKKQLYHSRAEDVVDVERLKALSCV